MLSTLFRPARLGDDYEIEDQALAGILAGLSFFGYALFIGIADATDTGSIVSALARFTGMMSVIAIAITVQFAFPRSMRPQKILMASLCGIGVIAQFMAVSQLMRPMAEVMAMYGLLRVMKICYIAVLVIFAYCLAIHPYFPTWIGPTLVILTSFWMVYYASIESGNPSTWLKYVVWSICYPLEYLCSISFILSASKILTEARARQGRWRPE